MKFETPDWVSNPKEIKKNVKWKNGIVAMIFNSHLFSLSIYYTCGSSVVFFKIFDEGWNKVYVYMK